jgi:hypothetical protein
MPLRPWPLRREKKGGKRGSRQVLNVHPQRLKTSCSPDETTSYEKTHKRETDNVDSKCECKSYKLLGPQEGNNTMRIPNAAVRVLSYRGPIGGKQHVVELRAGMRVSSYERPREGRNTTRILIAGVRVSSYRRATGGQENVNFQWR